MLRVFIGHDSREAIAASVLEHSIQVRASRPVSVTRIALHQLHGIYTRWRSSTESTEFSLSRFLVPYLCDYQGYAVFMDCDMLCRCDLPKEIDRVIQQSAPFAVACCQHDYTPSSTVKFLDQPQTVYPRKNWSSFMVMDTSKCQALTPQYVNDAPGLALHRFHWLHDMDLKPLPLDFNWLVGEYPPNPDAKVWHYTLGGPWFEAYRQTGHAQEWLAERAAMYRVQEPSRQPVTV